MPKILILHGWNWKNYPKHNQGNPWLNRFNFLNSLKQNFEVDAPTLPGFCDSSIPTEPWNLDTYADWLFQQVQAENYDKIIGYSFGSAIIVRFLTLYADKLESIPKIVLISPAISRNYQHKTRSHSLILQMFPNISRMLRDVYLAYIIKNPFYTEGDYFQRETYRNIVQIDLSQKLEVLMRKNISINLIFGSNDTATPPEVLFSKVPEARNISTIIYGGGHDIANSHTEELIKLLQI